MPTGDAEQRVRQVEESIRLLLYDIAACIIDTEKDIRDILIMVGGDPDGPSSTPTCGGTLTVNVKCGTTNQSGFSVSVTNGTTTLTGTTNSSGNATFTGLTAGSWTGSATKSGFTTATFSFTWACANQTINVTSGPSSFTISGVIKGCNGVVLPGAFLTFTQSGSTVATATTNSSGAFSVSFASDGSNVGINTVRTRFDPETFTVTSTCVTSATYNATMSPTAGYQCDPCGGGPMPISETLHLSLCGSTYTITYDGVKWVGSGTITRSWLSDCDGFPCNYSTFALPVNFEFSGTGLTAYNYANCSPTTYGVCSGAVNQSYAIANPGKVTNLDGGQPVRVATLICSGTGYVNFPFNRNLSGNVTNGVTAVCTDGSLAE